jgi:hypothetical protein
MTGPILTALLALAAVVLARASPGAAGNGPEWVARVRKDHPRLFFNAETWPAARARALGPEHAFCPASAEVGVWRR